MNNGRGNTLNVNSNHIDQEVLDRLKSYQQLIKRSWQGLNVKIIGQPGNSSIVNKKYKREEATDEEVKDQEKQTMLFDLACKLKELEELSDIRSSQNLEET